MALNGGVSLAVWMGGCAVELDCARRAHWGPEGQSFDGAEGEGPKRTAYASLCRAFRRELVIDIMSGASAGGVNGGLLAGAMVSGRRLHPRYVRGRWLDLGDFSKLLHATTDTAPRSLLQGQHFVDSLLEVFEDLAAEESDARAKGLALPDPQSARAERSIPHLDVTVTDVRGTERTYRDRWGGIFAAREYRRRFSFREQRDFTPENLAVAARCSASFPAAFEPYRPNAGSWSLTDRAGLEPSGEGPPWTIDGGLLDNSPIRAAIELIPRRAANRQVKRYLVYVNPEPHGPLEPGAASVGTNADGQTPSVEPQLANVAGYVVNLPRKLPFVDQLDAIEDAVQRSLLVADGTLDLLLAPIETVESAAQALLPTYTTRRALQSLRDLLGDPAAAERAYEALDAGAGLPWIPTQIGLGDPARWEWGLSAAIRVCHFLLDLIRKGIAERPGDLELFLEARVRLDRPLADLQAAYDGSQDNQELIRDLRSEEPRLGREQRVAALQGLAGDQSGALPAVRSAVCIFRDLLSDLEGELTLPRAAGEGVEVGSALFGEAWQDDMAFREACQGDPRKRGESALTEPERHCLRRLLSIEVIRRAYTAEEPVDSAQKLDFVQLTPDAPTPILSSDPFTEPYPASSESKLTGIRLGHFAGFLKSSWRANDFMWGRLDAAARIVDLLVDPARAGDLNHVEVANELAKALMGDDATLEQRCLVTEVLGDGAGGTDEPPAPGELRPRLQQRLAEDLAKPDGDALFTRTVFTRASQLEIVGAELPAIAEATRADAADGSATKGLDFGQVDEDTGELPPGGVLWKAIDDVREGSPLPVRLGRDDPAETTSDLTARMAARAGFVTLAALRAAQLPAARALDLIRPPLLAVTGMSARGPWLRIPLVLGFWAAALYMAARVLDTQASADIDSIVFNQFLLAAIAAVTVLGVAALPVVRGLRRRWQPVAFGEFAATLLIIVAGGGAPIGLALGLGDGFTPADLIVGSGFDAPPDGVLDLAIIAALGLPLAQAILLSRVPSWILDLMKGGAVSAVLLGVVSILVSVWTVQNLVDAIGEGPAWRTIAALTALILPPLVCSIYLLLHNVSSGPRSG